MTDNNDKLFARVRASAGELTQLSRSGLNIPVEDYIQFTDLDAIAASLSVPETEWNRDTLETILIIRDGIYDTRERLRDLGDDDEHSVDRLLGGLDRLYADFERALRALESKDLTEAQESLSQRRTGPSVNADAIQTVRNELTNSANEVLIQTNNTSRRIEMNLFNFSNSNININIDVLRNTKLAIDRLSASVFSLKLSLQQSVIYQGVFSFLNDSADEILKRIKSFTESIKSTYKGVKDFIEDLEKISSVGGRFTKLIAEFISDIFATPDYPTKQINFKIQSRHVGDVLTCADRFGQRVVAFGRSGLFVQLDPATGGVVGQSKLSLPTILCCETIDETAVAVGTDDGLAKLDGFGPNKQVQRSSYREKVTALAVVPWGGYGRGIVTGSQEGFIRRWSISGGLEEYTEGLSARRLGRKIGRTIKSIVPRGGDVLVASGSDLHIVDENLESKSKIHLPGEINKLIEVDQDGVVAIGEGHISQINLSKGTYTRIISSSPHESYTSAIAIDDDIIVCGTHSGKLVAISLRSGAEVGTVDLDIRVRDLVLVGRKILAVGGPWNNRQRSIAAVIWEEVTDTEKP